MLFIGGLLVSSIWIMLLFLVVIICALTWVIATLPLMLWVIHTTGNRRGIAVLAMTVIPPPALIVLFWAGHRHHHRQYGPVSPAYGAAA